MKKVLFAALCMSALSACREDIAAGPSPLKMTPEALGHYCQMNLVEHPGPKAQVHLKGVEAPIYFAQVRDAIAYQRMPEQSHAIAAIFVNDMAVASSWEAPGDDNWIAAQEAHFVVGSDRVGGMGAPELVPFSDRISAEQFAADYGGRILELGSIPNTEVLAPSSAETATSDDQEFRDRLSRLGSQTDG